METTPETRPQALDLSAVAIDDDVKTNVTEELALVPRVNAATIARFDAAILTLDAQAPAFACETPADYSLGDAAIGRIRQLERVFAAIYGPEKQYWTAKLALVRAEEAKRLPLLERAKKTVGAKMLAWRAAEDKRVADEKRLAEATERRRAEDVRLAQADQVADRGKAIGSEALRDAALAMLDQPLDIVPARVESRVPTGGATKVQYRDSVEVTDLRLALIGIGVTLLLSDEKCPESVRVALHESLWRCKSAEGILDADRTAKGLCAALETWARGEYKVRGERFVVPGIFAGKKPVLG